MTKCVPVLPFTVRVISWAMDLLGMPMIFHSYGRAFLAGFSTASSGKKDESPLQMFLVENKSNCGL